MDLIEVGPTDKRVDAGRQPRSLTILCTNNTGTMTKTDGSV